MHWQLAGERPLLDSETAACHAETPRTEPLAEVRNRARTKRDVDVRIELEEPLALRFRVAAADRDDRVRPRALLRRGVADVGREFRIGLLADRAGVEDEDVRLLP